MLIVVRESDLVNYKIDATLVSNLLFQYLLYILYIWCKESVVKLKLVISCLIVSVKRSCITVRPVVQYLKNNPIVSVMRAIETMSPLLNYR